MKQLKKIGGKLLIFCGFLTLLGQRISANEEIAEVNQNNGTIEQRIDDLISSSNNYQEYKVIKKTALNSIKETILDTIKELENSLNKSNKTIDEKSEEITILQENLKEINENLKQVTNEKDRFSFFGLLINKKLYNTLLWGFIIVLLISLFIIYGMFKRASKITIKTKTDIQEIEEEFENHRKTSLEREQKIKRELQDYKNKEKYKSQ